MNEQRKIIIIRFDYKEKKYLLPLVLSLNNNNKWKSDIELFNSVIKKMEDLPNFKKVSVHDGRIDVGNKLFEEYYDILNAPNSKIKYLRVQTNEIVDKTNYKYSNFIFDDQYFEDFPVRIIDANNADIFDDELPIIEFEE